MEEELASSFTKEPPSACFLRAIPSPRIEYSMAGVVVSGYWNGAGVKNQVSLKEWKFILASLFSKIKFGVSVCGLRELNNP